MKRFVLIFLFLFTMPAALACKPSPLPSCDGEKSIAVDSAALEKLRDRVVEFQRLLSKSIPPDHRRSSCFNKQFATFYLMTLKGPQTCDKQISIIEGTVGPLINSDSEEWRSIQSDITHANLKRLAQDVRLELSSFLKAHSSKSIDK